MKRVPCILSTDRRRIVVALALLDTPEDRAQGYRGRMPPASDDEGLLFLWPAMTHGPFNMRGVPFGLDLCVGAEDGTVTGCCTMPANSADLFTPAHPFRFAVELRAGWRTRNGVPSRLALA